MEIEERLKTLEQDIKEVKDIYYPLLRDIRIIIMEFQNPIKQSARHIVATDLEGGNGENDDGKTNRVN